VVPAASTGGHGTRVLVAGATGYLGRRLVPRLVARGHIVRALVRGGEARARAFPHLSGCEIAEGDVLDPASCAGAALGCDAIAHLVGIIKEQGLATFDAVHVGGTVALVQAARHAGVGRFLYVSALGARRDAPTAYWRTKAVAEETVANSGLSWIILRPSLVLARDGEFYKVLRQLTAFGIVPVLGSGTSKLAPVLADDLADLEAAAFDAGPERASAWNRVHTVCGSEAIPFNELLRRTAKGRGRPALLVHVPLVFARPLVEALARVLPDPPVTPGQLAMLLEDSTCDPAPAARAFGVTLHPIGAVLGRAQESP